MKGYNDKRRKLFIRITATVLAVLMVATVFSVLLFRYEPTIGMNPQLRLVPRGHPLGPLSWENKGPSNKQFKPPWRHGG